MLPQFLDRKYELKLLEDLYSRTTFKFFILYGRRRVGKTELLKHFLKGKKGIYALATDENLRENIRELKTKFYELTKKDYFLKIETDSIYDLFKYLSEEVKDNVVIIIDEFPYLLNLNKGLLSTFQKIADELLKDSKIMLILCGSSLAVMENDVLGYKSPLYGREMNNFKLMPFNFITVYSAIKDIEKAIESYFIFGNVPYYLKFFKIEKDISSNIRDSFLTKGMNLYDEPLILLRQEFKESRTYRLILKYISLGYTTMGKLCSACGIDKSNIMKYLSTLEETNIIRHILPFGMKRKGYYEITDSFFRFWFRFVYPNKDNLEIGDIVSVEKEIKKEINTFFGKSFEYLIEELMKSKLFDELKEFSNIHKWWHKDKEIDIVAFKGDSKEILLCECKWQEDVEAEKIIRELNEKAKFLKWNNENRKEIFSVFAKSFKKRLGSFENKKVYCYDLRDIRGLLEKNISNIFINR